MPRPSAKRSIGCPSIFREMPEKPTSPPSRRAASAPRMPPPEVQDAHFVVAAGVPPAVEPWRPARRKNRATLLDAGNYCTAIQLLDADPGGKMPPSTAGETPAATRQPSRPGVAVPAAEPDVRRRNEPSPPCGKPARKKLAVPVMGVPQVSQPAVSPISQSAGRSAVGWPSGVAPTFLSAVSRAFLPAGRRDDSDVRFLGDAGPTGKSAERQTRMSAVRVWSRTRLAVRWPNGPQVGPAARDAIRQTGPAKREAVRGKSPSPTAATERPARAGSPPSFFLYQHPEGVPAFNLSTF